MKRLRHQQFSNHAGYAPLWREQLGETWWEAGTTFTWPVLACDDVRWAVRAAIDAVVAHAYGLTRDQYANVLNTFSHSSHKDATRQCLAAFTKKHDPYWNVPLNENLPQPAIDLSGLANGERWKQAKKPNSSSSKPILPHPVAVGCSLSNLWRRQGRPGRRIEFVF